MSWPAPPPTRILSWQQMVLQADPGYIRSSLQPWVYEFSNDRLFVDPLPLYGTSASDDGWVDSDGNAMYDNAGNRMRNG